MHSKTWLWAAAAGGFLLLLAALAALQTQPQPCGDLPTRYPPIVAFELMRTPRDVEQLFGRGDSACRSALIESFDQSSWGDTWLFVPSYGVFLVSFFLGLRVYRRRLGQLGSALALSAVVADYVENWCLMQLTPDLDTSSRWFALLPWATGVKWSVLGLAASVAGLLLLATPFGSRAARFLGCVLCSIALVVTIVALADPARFGWLLLDSTLVSFLVYLTFTCRAWIAQRSARVHASQAAC